LLASRCFLAGQPRNQMPRRIAASPKIYPMVTWALYMTRKNNIHPHLKSASISSPVSWDMAATSVTKCALLNVSMRAVVAQYAPWVPMVA